MQTQHFLNIYMLSWLNHYNVYFHNTNTSRVMWYSPLSCSVFCFCSLSNSTSHIWRCFGLLLSPVLKDEILPVRWQLRWQWLSNHWRHNWIQPTEIHKWIKNPTIWKYTEQQTGGVTQSHGWIWWSFLRNMHRFELTFWINPCQHSLRPTFTFSPHYYPP